MRTKYVLIVLSAVVAMAAVAVVVSAGNPDAPPGPPEMAYSYGLEDIYDRLDQFQPAQRRRRTYLRQHVGRRLWREPGRGWQALRLCLGDERGLDQLERRRPRAVQGVHAAPPHLPLAGDQGGMTR